MPARTAFSFGPKQLRKAILRSKSVNIAVLMKDLPEHESILDGCLDELSLRTSVKPSITRIPGNFKWCEVHAIALEIVKKRPGSIVTIGVLCSQLMRQVLKEEGVDIPLFHGGVERPEFFGLLPSLTEQFRATGVTGGQPIYTATMHVLSVLRPQMKHLLIPYSVLAAGGMLTNAVAVAKRYCENRNIKITVAPFFRGEMPMERIASCFDGVDTVMCFEGCETHLYKEALIAECKKRGVVVYGGSPDLLKQGAALGHVLDYSSIGKALARYIYKALWLGMPLSSLPFLSLGANARRIVINEEVVKELGVTFDEDVMHLIQRGTVYGNIFLGDAGMLLGEEMPEKEEY